jgi:hypothetical protein
MASGDACSTTRNSAGRMLVHGGDENLVLIGVRNPTTRSFADARPLVMRARRRAASGEACLTAGSSADTRPPAMSAQRRAALPTRDRQWRGEFVDGEASLSAAMQG